MPAGVAAVAAALVDADRRSRDPVRGSMAFELGIGKGLAAPGLLWPRSSPRTAPNATSLDSSRSTSMPSVYHVGTTSRQREA